MGFPVGLALAWAITLGELAGALCLLWGRYLRLAIPIHLVVLLGGIARVHGREGWFVVGGGRNGVEFSVALIVALCALGVAAFGWEGPVPEASGPTR